MIRRTVAAGAAVMAMAAGLTAAGLAAPAGARTVQAAVTSPCAPANDGKVRLPLGLGSHVLFAVADGYGTNYVTVTECERSGLTWKQILDVPGRIGTKGYAPPGDKREGDGRSPSGSYSMDMAFGEGDPGTGLLYHKLLASNECWGSTVGTIEYNQYFHGTCRSTDEDLVKTEQAGMYKQVAVINYNRLPDSPVVQGNGSAIFLHIKSSGATAGCVSVSAGNMKSILRTLHPGDRILMGTKAVVFS